MRLVALVAGGGGGYNGVVLMEVLTEVSKIQKLS